MRIIPVLILALVTLIDGPDGILAQSDPGAAIFRLSTIEKGADGKYHGSTWGTAFFVGSDGTALTAGHVARHVVNHPDRYVLMAIVNGELYGATVVCANKLPDALSSVPLGKDIAEIKLTPFAFPFSFWQYKTESGRMVTLGTAHRGELPEFPTLTIGGTASGHVRVVGYGSLFSFPTRWTAEGYVDVLPSNLARYKVDSTPMFAISFNREATGGDSGAPVLNDQNEVVGLFTWAFSTPNIGMAEMSDVLRHPCE